MNRKIEMRWREELEPWDDLYAHIHEMCGGDTRAEQRAFWTVVESLERLNSATLLRLQEAAADAGQTNCWWVTYQVRNAIQCVVEALA